MQRLGLDHASLAERYPRLIYASVSGYGQTGPLKARAGYDAVTQAESGLMSVTGEVDGPPVRLGVPIGDLAAGLFAAQGILAALVSRAATGRGQHVDVSMLDSVAALLTYHATAYLTTGESPPRMGNGHASIVPYNTFAAKDAPLMLAVGNDDQWRRFCAVAGARNSPPTSGSQPTHSVCRTERSSNHSWDASSKHAIARAGLSD